MRNHEELPTNQITKILENSNVIQREDWGVKISLNMWMWRYLYVKAREFTTLPGLIR